jgi:hypothetical protein
MEKVMGFLRSSAVAVLCSISSVAIGQTPTSISIVGMEARFVSLTNGNLGPNSIKDGGKPYTDAVLFYVVIADKRSVPMEIFDLEFSVRTKTNGKVLFKDTIKEFNTMVLKTTYFPFLSRIGPCDDFQVTAKLINSRTNRVQQVFQKTMPFDCGD